MISRKFNGQSNVTGQKIRQIRESKNLSQADLSDKLMILGIDINSDGIYKIEKGRRIIKDFELSAISIILDTSETELLSCFRTDLLKNISK